LDQLYAAAEFRRDFVEYRAERPARAAPLGPEIDDDGEGFGGFENLRLESRGRDVHAGIIANAARARPARRFTAAFRRLRERSACFLRAAARFQPRGGALAATLAAEEPERDLQHDGRREADRHAERDLLRE